MKKRTKGFFTVAGVCAATLCIGCFAVQGYYAHRFWVGTFINGIYCTGKTVEQVNGELAAGYAAETLILQDAEGREYEIPLSSVDFKIDYSGQLSEWMEDQNAFRETVSEKNSQLFPEITFDENALEQKIRECGIAEANQRTQEVVICREKSYQLYDGMREVLDIQQVITAAEQALWSGSFFVDVSDCYGDLPYTQEMQDTLTLWEKIARFQDCGIVYDMGDEQIIVSPEMASGFILTGENGEILLDEKGELLLSEEGMAAFVDWLCETYNTVGASRVFHATRGEDVVIEGGTYGSILDREGELDYLREALSEGRREIHVPAYLQCGFVRGKQDIGTTYVEVDMTEQKLYYYEEGTLFMETDIVTGNTSKKWGTPSGVNYVYAMQKNRTLRGRDYASYVKFWVPVVGNIGIHDASWRKEFGGEIYKKNGSHGCINVPRERMEELFGYLKTGIPVVMFY